MKENRLVLLVLASLVLIYLTSAFVCGTFNIHDMDPNAKIGVLFIYGFLTVIGVVIKKK